MMDDEDIAGQQMMDQDPAPHVNNLQVGFVRIIDEVPRDIWTSSAQEFFNKQTWEKHFAPKKDKASVPVPLEWADFFSSMLLAPSHFKWAKEFIQSNFAIQLSPGSSSILFSIPQSCSTTPNEGCSKLSLWSKVSTKEEDLALEEEKLEEESDFSSPTRTPAEKVRLVETEVRRSTRLKIRNRGFKSTSCNKVNCIGCCNEPPTLSPAVMRNLGQELAQIDPELLTDEKLMKKRKLHLLQQRRLGERRTRTRRTMMT